MTPLLFLVQAFMLQAQSTFIPRAAGDGVNTPYAETHPVISPDGKKLFFVREGHPDDAGKKAVIYAAIRQADGSWAQAQPVTALNPGKTNLALAVTEKVFLLSVDGYLYTAKAAGDGWEAPVKTGIKSKDASLSPDGRYLLQAKGGKLFILIQGNDGQWGQAIEATGIKDVASPYLANDNKTLYFTQARKGKKSDIWQVNRTDNDWNHWTTPQPLNDTINTATAEQHMRTSPNGAWGYYTAQGASGKPDIYSVKIYEDLPYVLVRGHVKNEVTGRVLRNKDMAVMLNGVRASFFTVNRDSGTFTVRVPFGQPYEISAVIDHYAPRAAVFNTTTDREYREANLDLVAGPVNYVLLKGRLLIKNTEKTIPAAAKPQIVIDGEVIDSAYVDAEQGVYQIKLRHGSSYYVQVSAHRFESFPEPIDLAPYDGYEEIVLDLLADAEKMAIVSGTIIDKKTGKSLQTGIPVKVQVEGVSAIAAPVDSVTSVYEMRLPLKEKYVISAASPNYYPIYETIDVSQETREVKLTKNLVVVPIERGQSVRLNHVYFELGKTVMTTESHAELDRLIAFLQANPAIKIEIGAHTDRSSKVSTLNMAKEVMMYLINNGIARNRVMARGYAATKPVSKGKTPEDKAMNRRVEFTILD